MKKINEFVNNNLVEEFKVLKEELIFETGRLSDPDVMKQANSYKKIISKGDYFLPFLIDLIISGDGNLGSFAFYILVEDITDISFIDNGDSYSSILKKGYEKWWEVNKFKYGKKRIL